MPYYYDLKFLVSILNSYFTPQKEFNELNEYLIKWSDIGNRFEKAIYTSNTYEDKIKTYTELLDEANSLLDEYFEINNCKIFTDHVVYQNIRAEKIFFCDGTANINQPLFNRLPYAPNKGEVIIAEIPLLPANNIYKQGISIVPWKDGLFWIGSTYNWQYENLEPTTAFREKVEQQLSHWLRLPYKIMDHIVAERPANVERRPFVGLHPQYASVGILNGMGTKGCSLAPYFATELKDHVLKATEINPLADIQRFKNILIK
jgi:hypothetical protein